MWTLQSLSEFLVNLNLYLQIKLTLDIITGIVWMNLNPFVKQNKTRLTYVIYFNVDIFIQ